MEKNINEFILLRRLLHGRYRRHALKTIETCNICSKNDLVELIQLPKMPLTGLYLDKRNLKDDLYDQALNYCNYLIVTTYNRRKFKR